MSEQLIRAGQRLMLRTGRSRLKVLWRGLYALLIRTLARLLRWRYPERSVYLAGSFASGEAVYGLSDLDLTVVVPGERDQAGEARDRALLRWRAIRRRLRIPEGLVQVGIFDQALLAPSATTFSYGLDSPLGSEPALYHGPPATTKSSAWGLLHGPGMGGPTRNWRRIAGPERRPDSRLEDPRDRPLVVWLSLQSWWRFVFKASLEPERPWTQFLCVKLIAEPIRMLSWLERGELIEGRLEPLKRASELSPAFERSAQRALELYRSPSASPKDPLRETLPDFVELSAVVASQITRAARSDGGSSVRLVGGDEPQLVLAEPAEPPEERRFPAELALGPALPLVDWRALCFRGVPDEAFRVAERDPGDPEAIASAARLEDGSRYAAFATEELFVLPVSDLWDRGILRSVQCPATDPVSFALIAGQRDARFPMTRGWSAEAWARRAVAEHRAWLNFMERARAVEDHRGLSLGKLLSATRAWLFSDSLEAGAPELSTTLAATVGLLGERLPEAAEVAEEALERFSVWRRTGEQAPRSVAVALRDVVRTLPAYARPEGVRRSPAPVGENAGLAE